MKYATQSTIIKKRIYFIKYCGTYKIRLQIVRAQIYIFIYDIMLFLPTNLGKGEVYLLL